MSAKLSETACFVMIDGSLPYHRASNDMKLQVLAKLQGLKTEVIPVHSLASAPRSNSTRAQGQSLQEITQTIDDTLPVLSRWMRDH